MFPSRVRVRVLSKRFVKGVVRLGKGDVHYISPLKTRLDSKKIIRNSDIYGCIVFFLPMTSPTLDMADPILLETPSNFDKSHRGTFVTQ